MRQIFIFITFFLALQSTFLNAQNDSIPKKKSHFLVGIRGAVNQTRDVFLFGNSKNGSDSKRAFKIGGEGEFFVGYTSSKKQIHVGFGYSENNTQFSHDGLQKSKDYLRYRYKFYTATVYFNWLVGKKSVWIIGPNAGYASLFYFADHGHIDAPPVTIDYRRTFRTPQNTGWLGFTFGRLFPLNDHFEAGVYLITKTSSLILGQNAVGFKSKTADRSFLVNTININLTFKI